MSESPTPSSEANAAPGFTVGSAQYAAKKRRRPKAKKNKDAEEENAKSNPSKRHRDRLNKELEELAQLIPLPKDVLEKLDKLSILRLVVSYLRNKSYHSVESSNNFENELNQLLSYQHETQVGCLQKSESDLALKALHGFLMVVTQDFNIFFVSETVQDYLGFPQSDMMNLSMLDFVHVDDREIFMRQMRVNQKDQPAELPVEGQATIPEYVNMGMTPEEFKSFSQDGFLHRSFICRLRCLPDTSSGFLALHFTGHLRLVPGQNKTNEEKILLPPEIGLFLLVSPLQSPSILEIRTKNYIFRTKHKLDYTPLGIDAKGKIVLGYSDQLFLRRSGYEFVHSADMMHCADSHTKLMRIGESGYTVFRLLHNENHWVWVTATARLVYKNGRPECIIATQRPIQDQEGEEHMKKRSNAFRFDFTGQAILYGEINPIGIKGGPEKNPLVENMEEPPSHKRQRLINPNDVDRTTLYGAQAMQSMDIYMGNLPNQSTDFFGSRSVHASRGAVQNLIKDEQIGDNMGPLSAESNVKFFPIEGELSQEDKERIMKQRFRNPNNLPALQQPFQQNYAPVNLNRQLSNNMIDDQAMMQGSTNDHFLNTSSGAQLLQHSHLKRPFPTPSSAGSTQYQREGMQESTPFPTNNNQPLKQRASMQESMSFPTNNNQPLNQRVGMQESTSFPTKSNQPLNQRAVMQESTSFPTNSNQPLNQRASMQESMSFPTNNNQPLNQRVGMQESTSFPTKSNQPLNQRAVMQESTSFPTNSNQPLNQRAGMQESTLFSTNNNQLLNQRVVIQESTPFPTNSNQPLNQRVGMQESIRFPTNSNQPLNQRAGMQESTRFPTNSNQPLNQRADMQESTQFPTNSNQPLLDASLQQNFGMQNEIPTQQQHDRLQYQKIPQHHKPDGQHYQQNMSQHMQHQQQNIEHQQNFPQQMQQSPQQPMNAASSQPSRAVQRNQSTCAQPSMSFSPSDSKFARTNITAQQRYHDELNGLTTPVQHFNNPNTGQAPSVIDAMTINSVVNVPGQRQVMGNQLPQEASAESQLVGSQNNTIRFDLDKVASAYQTTNPLAKIEEYMRDNPSHAIAIATGLVPGPNMPKLSSKNVKSFIPVPSQYPQVPQHFQQSMQQSAGNFEVGRKSGSFPPSVGNDSDSDFFSSFMGSDDGASYHNPSISSENSMSTSSMPDNSPMDGIMMQQYNRQLGFRHQQN